MHRLTVRRKSASALHQKSALPSSSIVNANDRPITRLDRADRKGEPQWLVCSLMRKRPVSTSNLYSDVLSRAQARPLLTQFFIETILSQACRPTGATTSADALRAILRLLLPDVLALAHPGGDPDLK